ncbi:MAG: asparagine synthetase B family protein, partial [Planctomycetota bacterium]
MCGFAGEFVFGAGASASAESSRAMAARLAHHDADDVGTWMSEHKRCAIGFLPGALASDQRAAAAVVGDVLNLPAGDAEALLALWRSEGEEICSRLEGALALAVYDAADGKLFLARDRLGHKGLWYAPLADRVVFATSAAALLAHPGVSAEVDPASVAFYLTLGYVPAPRSMWRGVLKLPPAHCMTVGAAPAAPRRYWSLPERTEKIRRDEAVARVRQAFSAAVAERMAGGGSVGALI